MIIDLRPLLHGNISGVEIFTKNIVRELVKTAPEGTNIIFWVNARKKFDFGEFETMGTCVQTHIPNILFNLSASLFRWPKIDKMIDSRRGETLFSPRGDRGDETLFSPYGVDKNLDANMVSQRSENVVSHDDNTIPQGNANAQGGENAVSPLRNIVFVPDPRPSPISSQCQKIMTVHDLSAFRFPETFNWKTRLFHKLIRLKKEIEESRKVIAVSKFTQQEILDYRLCEAEKIEVVYEAAEPEYFNDAVIPKQPPEPLPSHFFLSLSTLEPRKNLQALIEAFLLAHKENQDLQLVLVGKRNPKIFSKLNLDKHPNITCIERFISIEEKKWLYKHATGFLFLSQYEGFGLPILEAMSQGCPVICGNNSAQKEVAGTAGILVDVRDVSAMSKEILGLDQDQELRKHLSEQSLLHAKTFSWKESAVKIHTFSLF